MNWTSKRSLSIAFFAVLGLAVTLTPACGGGSANGVTGRGLVMLSFEQAGVANTVLNEVLVFRFSEAVDVNTINSASVQIREGKQFGKTVPGTFIVSGSTVQFQPVLASLCDNSDAAFKPDTQYRVQVIGHPEEFSIRNTAGQPLSNTETYEFHTRLDTDPDRYRDAIPGTGPIVTSTSPANGDAGVAVAAGNRIEVVLTENVNPCTITDDTVLVHMYEGGAATMEPIPGTVPQRYSGFAKGGSVLDQTPGDAFTWGADGTSDYSAAPRKILCNIKLVQDFGQTRIEITPLFGYNPDPLKSAPKFPENCLIVVQMSFSISDYGGLPMVPYVFAFTTENLAPQESSYLIENKGETPYIDAQTTAAVHPDPRSPERVQGFMLFAGDGDNGPLQLQPSLPKDVDQACGVDLQDNDGITDDFDPATSVLLDTGSTPNTCVNSTDGSTAVVWEFNTFRIRNGITVRIVGRNPAIILVSGDVVIENGGRLLVHGDGTGGSPAHNGQNGQDRYTSSSYNAKGGIGVAGGGDGGDGNTVAQAQAGSWAYGQDGFAGFGATNYDPSMNPAGTGHGGDGAGGAGSPSGSNTSSQYNPWDAGSAGGGGAGHATAGTPGETKQGNIYKHKKATRSFAGGVFGDTDSKMAMPEAGSGGASSGAGTVYPFNSSSSYGAAGAAGGAGGGFVDLTSSGTVTILGGIYAIGGRGGNGDGWSAYGASAGAGGGSGGGIRVLTPNNMTVGATAVISTAGGSGGSGYPPYSNAANRNLGGSGGTGRIALEDDDSIISGIGAANIVPTEGDAGFYRGQFNAGRFQGGGLAPQAVSELVPIGNYAGFNPTFMEPTQSYGVKEDFKAGIPVSGTPGPGNTAILVEARGYQMNTDGTSDLGSETSWVSVGYFRDSGVESFPTFALGHPGDKAIPLGNTGGAGGFTELNGLGGGGHEFLQFRFTMYLPSSVGPFDPGAYVDDWLVRFTHDN